MENQKTIPEILKDYENGKYRIKREYERTVKVRDGHIFDEEKSVRWNREQVAAHNEAVNKYIRDCWDTEVKLNDQFKQDIVSAIISENPGINVKNIREVVDNIWDEVDKDVDKFETWIDKVIDLGEKLWRQ